MSPTETPVLQVENLVKTYKNRLRARDRHAPKTVNAVRGVSLTIRASDSVGLVGESGCGKTSLANAILMLDPPTAGNVLVNGIDVGSLGPRERRALRQQMQVVFQDPYASLNPRMTVGNLVSEALVVRRPRLRKREIDDHVMEALEDVGLRASDAARFPGEFSGGQRQRIGIARALISSPSLLICDEPVSALDVSVQAQVLNLLNDLQQKKGLAYLFISHDLSVVGQLVDNVAVMYMGKIVEYGRTEDVFGKPCHPYTKALLDAAPGGRFENRRVEILQGDIPNPANVPSGCSFHPRCPVAGEGCNAIEPRLREVELGRSVACHYPLS